MSCRGRNGIWFLLLILPQLGIAVLKSLAQQTETDRVVVEEVKADAERGDADSEVMLGGYYVEGVGGLPQDSAKAVGWFRKAAEQNHALAQTCLGLAYAEGRGVAKDEVEAVRWFRKAAEQNHPPAQLLLGACYVTGSGVAKDEAEGVKWYRKAAEQNDAQGQFNLGLAYADGRGVAKDEVEGYKWFLLAARQGNEKAKKHTVVSESRLTPEQLAEGQKRARNFRPAKGH